jgi:ligand-binding sensor domain-containing protein
MYLMNSKRFFRSIISACLFCITAANAQDRPIGAWRSFLPYNNAIGLATDGNMLFAIANQGFYTYNSRQEQVEAFSKVEGMHDIGMQCVGYDIATSTAILVYANGNIDLFKDNTFYNIAELKIKTVAGAKNVYSVYTQNGLAYLSTSIGVIVIDLAKQNIKETYEFSVNSLAIPVKGITGRGDSLFALTTYGIYKASINSRELQNFQVWQIVDTNKGYNYISEMGGSIYAATDEKVYRVNGAGRDLVYTCPSTITHTDVNGSKLYVSEYNTDTYNGNIKIFTNVGLVDSIVMTGHKPKQIVTNTDGSVWIADEFGGLVKYSDNKEFGYYTPTGPTDFNSYDIYANNKDLWIAHGGFNGKYSPNGNKAGISNYKDDKWKYLTRFIYPPFDTLADFSVFLKDEISGVIYAGSLVNGLFILNPDGTYELLNQGSIFDMVPSIEFYKRQIAGMALDSKRNLWVTTLFSTHQLYVKTLENKWYKFTIPNVQFGGQTVVDDYDQIWFVGYNGDGVVVYNYGSNENIADKSDDASYHLLSGKGYGNLPSNTVNCIAKDNNNNMWIGTANGIGIVNNCNAPFTQSAPCDADIPIVQYDQYAGYLFAGNNVRAIAVDGANRKWVGTDDGVWLLSSDAGKIIYRYTVDNSPLPSNKIQKISIDKVTGDVYIGTEQGLVSYRSTAIEGGTTNTNIVSFPNPVPSGYQGTIAIKGLVANADVRITDISGQLVYRTKALGGQAVWNGLDYTGRRPQTGVYLIFASDANGAETYTGKLVFLK